MLYRKTSAGSKGSPPSSPAVSLNNIHNHHNGDDADPAKKDPVRKLSHSMRRRRGLVGILVIIILVAAVTFALLSSKIIIMKLPDTPQLPPPPAPHVSVLDVATDHFPKGELDALIRIEELEDMKEGVIPLVVKERLSKETPADTNLRLMGNRALIQYGDRLRNLILAGQGFLQPTSPESLPHEFLRQRLHDMAPWLKGNYESDPHWPFSHFPRLKPTGQALMICAGDKQYAYLDALLHSVRVVHQSDMNVHITYKGNKDLSYPSREKLQTKFDNLHFINLAEYFDLEAAKLNGWNLRIFGMLLVPEAHVAMLDVDVMLYQPPEELFQLEGYKEKGAHFFHDRIAPDRLWSPRQLLLRLQPQPSLQARKALSNGEMVDDGVPMFNEHVMESGIVLIDKTRRFRGLWAACLLLGRWDIRRFAQRDLVYGDKELYWTAFETVNEPYAFAKYYPGCIGGVLTDFNGNDKSLYSVSKNQLEDIHNQAPNVALCGRLLHLDDSGQPLWSNGGYLTKEDDRDSKTGVSKNGLQPLLFIDGGDAMNEWGAAGKTGLNQYWKFNEEMGVTCLYPNSRNIRRVPSEHAKRGTEAVNYFLEATRQEPSAR